jgi:hypothetical protein
MYSSLHAGQSIITEGEGYACMGDDKSRKATETQALTDAKRMATEYASTYIKSETYVADSALASDLISAYTNANIRILQELIKEWYTDKGLGECYRIRLKVEVIPDDKKMAGQSKKQLEMMESDPSAPLAVKVWTDKKEYLQNDRVKVYLKGNKPFYAKVVYRQVDGSNLQLLPNPYRNQNYFNGGVIYEIPTGDDHFDLEVAAPFGAEQVTVYASTAPIGNLAVTQSSAVYSVTSKPADIPIVTRGVKLIQKAPTVGTSAAAEFFETTVTVTTHSDKK